MTDCQMYEKGFYKKILDGDANEVELTASLEKLSKMLAIHYGTAPIIIIDEYDTPIQEGHSKDFYDEIIGFMRNFFSGAFKDNRNLSYGFLTGILRIAQESIFSGLNNLTVNSVMDEGIRTVSLVLRNRKFIKCWIIIMYLKKRRN